MKKAKSMVKKIMAEWKKGGKIVKRNKSKIKYDPRNVEKCS